MAKYLLYLLAISAIIAAVSASAATLYPTHDAYVSEQNHGTNYGGQNFLWVGWSALLIDTYIKFDVSAHEGKTIESADLRLYVYYLNTTTDHLISRNTEDWSEDTITWDDTPASADSSAVPGATTVDAYWEIDVTSYVQDFLDGTYENYGFHLTKDAPLDGFLYIWSKEYSSNQPELVLTLSSGVESASLGEIKTSFK